MTSWIDGSFIYSTTEPWVALMRSYTNGSLRMAEVSMGRRRRPLKQLLQDGYPPHNTEGVPLHNFPAPHLMKPADPAHMYVLGDPRTNQNPALLTFGILFYRWHNVLAARVAQAHITWSDEDIFQSARRLNIATLQNIIAYEYLPAFVGDYLAPYPGYQVNSLPPSNSLQCPNSPPFLTSPTCTPASATSSSPPPSALGTPSSRPACTAGTASATSSGPQTGRPP